MSSGLPTPATSALDQRQTDLGAQGRGVRPAGHHADSPAVQFHRVAVSGRTGSLQQSKPDRPPRGARFLDRGNGLTADERPLVELDGPTETRLDRADVVRELVPVQRHARFQAQRVARAKSDRLQTTRRTRGQAARPRAPPSVPAARRTRIHLRQCSQFAPQGPADRRRSRAGNGTARAPDKSVSVSPATMSGAVGPWIAIMPSDSDTSPTSTSSSGRARPLLSASRRHLSHGWRR